MKNSLPNPLEHSISNITSFPFFLYPGMGKREGDIVIMSQISKSINWTSARPWIFSKLIDHQILTLYICTTLEIIKLFGFFRYLKLRFHGHNTLRGTVLFQNYLEFIKEMRLSFVFMHHCFLLGSSKDFVSSCKNDKKKWRQTSLLAADSIKRTWISSEAIQCLPTISFAEFYERHAFL